jgi:hypothetical protein
MILRKRIHRRVQIRDLDRVSLFESLRRLDEERSPLGFARQELQA